MRRWVAARIVFVVTVAASLAQVPAQDPEPAPKPELPPELTRPWEASAGVRGRTFAPADFDDSDGDLSMFSARTFLRLEGPGWFGSFISATAYHEYRRYDFEGTQPFFPGLDDPWEDVNTAGIGVNVLQGIAKDWGVLLGANLRASAADDASIFDGVSGSVMLGVGHDFGGGFRAGAGVIAISRFERSLAVIPAFQFRWDIDEHWRLSLEGADFEARWKPDESWTLRAGAGFDGIRFRLPDGAVDEGIVEDRRLAVHVRATWRVESWIEIEAEIGADVWREIEVSDRNGDAERSFDLDPAMFGGIGVTLRF